MSANATVRTLSGNSMKSCRSKTQTLNDSALPIASSDADCILDSILLGDRDYCHTRNTNATNFASCKLINLMQYTKRRSGAFGELACTYSPVLEEEESRIVLQSLPESRSMPSSSLPAVHQTNHFILSHPLPDSERTIFVLTLLHSGDPNPSPSFGFPYLYSLQLQHTCHHVHFVLCHRHAFFTSQISFPCLFS